MLREILSHLGVPSSDPSLAPLRGTPLCALPIAGKVEWESDEHAWLAPDWEFEQRVAWLGSGV